MTDLIERLRSAPNAYAGYVMHEDGIIPADGRLMHEAADEIERLQDALRVAIDAAMELTRPAGGS